MLLLLLNLHTETFAEMKSVDLVSSVTGWTFQREIIKQKQIDKYHEEARIIMNDGQPYIKERLNYMQDGIVSALCDEGFCAYSIKKDNFEEIEELLEIDLDSMGLSKKYSYIMVIEDEDKTSEEKLSKSVVFPSYNYTYNGVNYELRKVTITGADDTNMTKASSVNILNSSLESVINNCLNTAIYAYIEYVIPGGTFISTVGNICGLSIDVFKENQTATMVFHGGSAWTRVYTQVKSPYDHYWYNGTYVEFVKQTSQNTGLYYDKRTNQYESVPDNIVYTTTYSVYYNDLNWQNTTAVTGFLSGYPNADKTGKTKFYKGSTLIITHNENF